MRWFLFAGCLRMKPSQSTDAHLVGSVPTPRTHRRGRRAELTETAIADWLKTAPVGALLWDAVPGFGVRRWQTRATFVLTYRAGRRARWLTLGEVGVRPLVKARKAAKVALGAVADGEDPAAARDEGRAAETMREAGDRWLTHIGELASRSRPASMPRCGRARLRRGSGVLRCGTWAAPTWRASMPPWPTRPAKPITRSACSRRSSRGPNGSGCARRTATPAAACRGIAGSRTRAI